MCVRSWTASSGSSLRSACPSVGQINELLEVGGANAEIHDHRSRLSVQIRVQVRSRCVPHYSRTKPSWYVTVQREDRTVEVLAAGDTTAAERGVDLETPRCLPCVAQRTPATCGARIAYAQRDRVV